jgi:hypothetical protein
VVALSAVACGGGPSAEDFAGLYRGSGTTVYTSSDGEIFRDTQAGWSTSLSSSVSSDKILFAGSCRITAVVTGEDTFELEPISCDLGSDADCHYVDRILSGEGKLLEEGMKLTLTLKGEYVQDQCAVAGDNAVFKYATTVTLKRQ